jgi:hypothetical protein
MDALTPAHGPCLEVASATSYLPWRPMLRRGRDGLGMVRPQPLYASRRDSLTWTGIPVSFAAPSVHSASNHPLPSRCVIWRFLPSGLPSNASLPMRRVLADRASWVSPFPSRLTTATGRIEFAVADRSQPILRTGRSPPVAPHPASRRRSYHQLRGTRHPPTRTSTSPMQQHYRRTRGPPHGGLPPRNRTCASRRIRLDLR